MADFKVQPCEAIPSQVINLSVPDASAPKSWATEILFWPLEDPGTFQTAHNNLRDGLGRLVADVPVLLGKLARGPKGHALDLTISIQDGAFVELPFEDASAIDKIPSYADLLRSGFPLTAALNKAVAPRASHEPMVEGSPLFCTKLTRIKGGVALAVGFSHVLTDGVSASGMERMWARHTVDVSQGLAFRRHKPDTPDEEIRNRLSTPATLDPASALDPFLQIVPAEESRNHLHRDAASAREASEKAAAFMMEQLAATGEKAETRGFAVWKFTPEKLADLKEAASSPNANEWISTMDALTALFWSRIALVLGQSAKGPQTSICLFMISLRQGLQPPIPNAYIGNVFTPAAAECRLAILKSGHGGLKAAAQSLRQASKEMTPSRWEAWLNRIMSLPVEQALSIKLDTLLQKHNFTVNDYSRFQSNTVDWGAPLGQVARTRYLKRALPAGACGAHVHPRLADGALEVSLMCSDALQQSLMEDTMFMRYADFLCQHP